MLKTYLRYVIPSMLSFVLIGVYSIVDGYFVGRSVGDAGLAAINVAWPLVSLMIAAGTGIGVGGAVVYALHMGAQREAKAQRAQGNSVVLLVIAAVVIMLLLLLWHRPLLLLIGAAEDTLEQACIYTRIMALGSLFQVLSSGLLPFIRNKGKTVYAMLSMGCGCLTNILLDWLFVAVFDWGIAGAAWASIIGQLITVVLAAAFLLRRENRLPGHCYRLHGPLVLRIAKIGISPLGLTFLPSAAIILTNVQALRYGGQTAVAAYAAVTYVTVIVQLIIQGISDGAQPLLSHHQGAGRLALVAQVRRLTLALTTVIGAAGGSAVYGFRHQLPVFFGTSQAAATAIAEAMPWFAAALFCYGFTRTATAYFYAIERNIFATVMVYGEIVVSVILILLLPLAMDLPGVWAASPGTQLVLCLMALAFLSRGGKKHGHNGRGYSR